MFNLHHENLRGSGRSDIAGHSNALHLVLTTKNLRSKPQRRLSGTKNETKLEIQLVDQ